MRAVEAVLRELGDAVEQRIRRRLRDVSLYRPRDELRAQLGHLGLVLLAHRLAQDVRLAHREAGQLPRGHHHLLLVDHHAIRLSQDRL